MQAISRLLNGISLQRGLLNNSIPVDELISELLNFGNLTSAQVQGIDSAKLTGMMEKINELSQPILHNDLEAVEKHFLGLGSIAKIVKGFDGTLEIPADHEYIQLLEKFSAEYNTSKPEDLISYSLKILKTTGIKDEQQHIFNVHIGMNYFLNLSLTSLEPFFSSKAVKTIKNPFPFLTSMNDAFLMYTNFSAVSIESDDISKLTTSIKNLGTTSEELAKHAQSLGYLYQMLVNRHQKHGNSVVKHTAGFLNGVTDIDKIFNDRENDWPKDAVDGQWNNIANALNLLNNIETSVKEVDSALGLKSDKAFFEVSAVQSLALKVSKLSAITNMLAGKVQNITIIPISALQLANSKTFVSLNSDVNSLSSKFEAFHIVYEMVKKLTAEDYKQKMTTVFEISKNFYTGVPSTFKSLKKSEELALITKLISTVKTSLDVLKDEPASPTMKTAAESVAKSLKSSIIKDNAVKIFNAVNPLNNISEIQHVQPVINAIRFYREATKEQLSLDSVAKILPNVKKELTKLTKFVNEKKERTNVTDPDVLEELKTTVTQLSVLGPATRGIFNMNMALNMKTNVSTVKDLGGVVKDEMAKVKLDPEDEKNLKVLIGLGDDLEKMLKSLKEFMSKVKPTDSKNLQDHAGIFEAAGKVKGLSYNFMDIKDSGNQKLKL